MSFFRERDEFIKKAFHDMFDSESDSDNDDDDEKHETNNKIIQKEDQDQNNTLSDNKHDDNNTIDDNNINTTSDDIVLNDSVEEVITLSSDDEDDDLNNSRLTDCSILEVIDTSTSGRVTRSNAASIRRQQQQQQQQLSINRQVENINNSQDFEDYPFKLKITLAGSYKQFPTTYKTKLYETLKELIYDLKNQDKGLILRSSNGEIIPLLESPYSLKLTPGVILEAIEISSNNNSDNNKQKFSNNDQNSAQYNPDEILVKIQDGNRKNTKEFKVLKDETILELKKIYAREINVTSIEKINFTFDGDLVDNEATLVELEIEDGCLIDVLMSN